MFCSLSVTLICYCCAVADKYQRARNVGAIYLLHSFGGVKIKNLLIGVTVFIVLYPLYLFYDDIIRIRLRVKNRFINRYLPLAVFGGVIVLSIAFAYLLAPTGIYLPGDMYLAFGEESYLDGLITIPTLYIYSLIGSVIFFLYYTISGFLMRVFNRQEYKYATYESPEPTNNTPTTSNRRGAPVKCCKYCRYYTVDMLGYRGCYCKRTGLDASEYASCDYFQD